MRTKVMRRRWLALLALVAAAAEAAFVPAGPMVYGGLGLRAVPLSNGEVLIVGAPRTQIYEPLGSTFRVTRGEMNVTHRGSAMVKLRDGRVLIAGGGAKDSGAHLVTGGTASEIFDPATETFTVTGPLQHQRAIHTATLLADGRVLIVGGAVIQVGALVVWTFPTPEIEVYDPSTRTFRETGLQLPITEHTATRLRDGRVLIAGGKSPSEQRNYVFDPEVTTLRVTGAMITPRYGHTATLLPDGRVLILGGIASRTLQWTRDAEIYDPATNSFTPAGSMPVGRRDHAAVLMNSGEVLIAGGSTDSAPPDLDSALIYDPRSRTFAEVGPMRFRRIGPVSAELPNGSVLIAAGLTVEDYGNVIAEIYVPPARNRAVRH